MGRNDPVRAGEAPRTAANLRAIVKAKLQENGGLEFKGADALRASKTPGKRDWKIEFARDVAAFANAGGGVIIFGIDEDGDGRALRLAGFKKGEISADQLGQIIAANLEPHLQSYSVESVGLPNDHQAFVVQVRQGGHLGPHQVRADGVYYRRYDRQNLRMQDHEIRSLMLSRGLPNVRTTLLARSVKPYVDLTFLLKNLSNEPALYTVVQILVGLPASQVTTFMGYASGPEPNVFAKEPGTDGKPRRQLHGTLFRQNLSVPQNMPIFMEHEFATLGIRVSGEIPQMIEVFTKVAGPGFFAEQWFKASRTGDAWQVNELDTFQI